MNDAPPTGRPLWIAGARPRTLPAAVVPVAVGAACAVGEGVDAWWRAIFALIVAFALQVGVNYANDYSDGVRGTDDERRVGPLRLVGSGLAPAASVKRAAQLSFAIAGVFGGVLALVVGPEVEPAHDVDSAGPAAPNHGLGNYWPLHPRLFLTL